MAKFRANSPGPKIARGTYPSGLVQTHLLFQRPKKQRFFSQGNVQKFSSSQIYFVCELTKGLNIGIPLFLSLSSRNDSHLLDYIPPLRQTEPEFAAGEKIPTH